MQKASANPVGDKIYFSFTNTATFMKICGHFMFSTHMSYMSYSVYTVGINKIILHMSMHTYTTTATLWVKNIILAQLVRHLPTFFL